MSNPIPPNLGIVITNPTVRKRIYGTYIVLLIVAGATQVAYAAIQLGQPAWLVAALAVLAYLGIPVGGLALVNSPAPGEPRVLEAIYSNPTTPTGGAPLIGK